MSIVSDVKETINDAGVFFVNQHIYDAINEAVLDAWGELTHDIGTATFTLTANQEYLSVPETILVPRTIWNNGQECYPVTLTNMEEYGEAWRAKAAGKPLWFVLWDTETFQVWPKSDGTYVYTMEGQRYPTFEINGTTTDFTSIQPLNKAIQFKAAASLAAMTRPDLEQAWKAEALDYFSSAKLELKRRFKEKSYGLKPGTRKTLEHLGDIRKSRNPRIYL